LRHVRCHSRRQIALADFVAPLSCLLYRADAWWKEGSGRELFGAMAAGVPVVCPRGSIYAEYLRDGVDALLYDDEDGALACLAALRDNPARAAAMGAAARESARRRFDPAALASAWRDVATGARP
jgi:glycosyltransferase involved in cell wall biosynthesis